MEKEVFWSKSSWKNYKIYQQPDWPDLKHYDLVINELKNLPSLVFSGETRKLISELSEVNKKNAFVLQVGNCAESFSDCNGPKIHNFLRIFLQMAFIIKYNTKKDVIKIGRIAGQYAKPRTSNFETINGIQMNSYRGDIVNDFTQTVEARKPNPERLKEGYFRSAATMNLIRAFIQGGYNDIQNLNDWEQHFFSEEIAGFSLYKIFAEEISNSFKHISSNSLSN